MFSSEKSEFVDWWVLYWIGQERIGSGKKENLNERNGGKKG